MTYCWFLLHLWGCFHLFLCRLKTLVLANFQNWAFTLLILLMTLSNFRCVNNYDTVWTLVFWLVHELMRKTFSFSTSSGTRELNLSKDRRLWGYVIHRHLGLLYRLVCVPYTWSFGRLPLEDARALLGDQFAIEGASRQWSLLLNNHFGSFSLLSWLRSLLFFRWGLLLLQSSCSIGCGYSTAEAAVGVELRTLSYCKWLRCYLWWPIQRLPNRLTRANAHAWSLCLHLRLSCLWYSRLHAFNLVLVKRLLLYVSCDRLVLAQTHDEISSTGKLAYGSSFFNDVAQRLGCSTTYKVSSAKLTLRIVSPGINLLFRSKSRSEIMSNCNLYDRIIYFLHPVRCLKLAEETSAP